jgi:hypothetical protein
LSVVDGDGCKEEIEMIADYRSRGFDLVNGTEGGEGVCGYKPVFTPEWRAKISAAKKGKKFSREHCRSISASRKGKKLGNHTTEEGRRKASARFKGIPLSPEHCEKLSIAAAKRWHGKGFKARDRGGILAACRKHRYLRDHAKNGIDIPDKSSMLATQKEQNL